MKRINFLILLLIICIGPILTESCKKVENCPTINCNTGTLNEATCICDCPAGFSGTNCETEDICITQNVICQNGGTCLNGTCDCPAGYTGTNCEQFDTTQIQALLDGGVAPKALYDEGVTLEQLYGKIYIGGFIFYLNIDDGTGMVAATEDQSIATWGCDGNDLMNLINVADCPGMGNCQQPVPEDTYAGARIGDGKANTDAILVECLEDGIAAKSCRDKGADWFLPSRGELSLMYSNLYAEGDGGFATGFYWSSTEISNDYAWVQSFNNGVHGFGGKGDNQRVRPARSF